jgi:myo-inositol-1(or 4)-monophosphatase
MDLEPIKKVGIRAAYQAGRILTEHFGNISQVTKKGAIDLVTEADIASEKAILATIHEKFPDHGILAEESGLTRGSAEGQWIIDPLDGTTNYAHCLPIYAVSIAYAQQDEVLTGIVFNPASGELFTAVRGQGAQLNGQPVHVSATSAVGDSLLVTGFPYDFHNVAPSVLHRFNQCLRASQGVRRLGSAALDLCYVACGRFEGFWEANLKPWDTAAGMLITREAGGLVTDYGDRRYCLGMQEILATNGHIHQAMLTLLEVETQS